MAKNYSLSDDITSPVSHKTLLSYANALIPLKKVQALKSGKISPEAKLDLRGLRKEDAKKALIDFIDSQAQKFERCVLIIYSVETSIATPPLIKNLVNQWLPQFKELLAFHSIPTKDENIEAMYVLLKKPIIEIPVQIPEGKRETSFLVEETKSMERKRRLAEQQGERQLGPVKAREHSEEVPSNGPEGELQNSILQHPDLDSQRFDGVDPNLNPEPPLNTDARREFDNEQREQAQEKQLRLGNMPKFSTAPTPRGP